MPCAAAHPDPVLLNAGWIETTGGDFRFYTDGVSPSVGRAMDALDRERLGLLTALGLEAVPAVEWDRRLYGLAGTTSYEVNRDSLIHRDIRAPESLRSRYLTEDVPFGLGPWLPTRPGHRLRRVRPSARRRPPAGALPRS